MPQRTFLMMLIVVCVTILCFVWMVRDSLCGFRIEQGNTVFVATLAYEVKRQRATRRQDICRRIVAKADLNAPCLSFLPDDCWLLLSGSYYFFRPVRHQL